VIYYNNNLSLNVEKVNMKSNIISEPEKEKYFLYI